MYIVAYIFLFFFFIVRTFLKLLLNIYTYSVLLFLSIFDFVAGFLSLRGKDDVALGEYAVSELSSEQSEVLDFFDTTVAPYARFFHDFFFNTNFIRVFWFFSFIVLFSHLSGAVVSNEYLLFGCIVFTFFLVYDNLVSLLAGVFAPSLDGLRTAVSKKLILLSEIAIYQSALVVGYNAAYNAFEALSADLLVLGEEKSEADYVVFDQTLVQVTLSSMFEAFTQEGFSTAYTDFVENAELDLISLDDVIVDVFLAEEIE